MILVQNLTGLPELDSGSDTDKAMLAESDEDIEDCGQAITADQQAIPSDPREDVLFIKKHFSGLCERAND